ncbi:MAG: methyltransferase domain-containing protein [Candidatus Bathyarchaeota archaeon]|jgi:cyclopropane fatty-acyl-phospholipid synthase-like methyltransferase
MAQWNQILQRKDYTPENPDEIVVDFAAILERRETRRILDLGCGAGRHVIYLAKQGFQTCGADISETGLKLTNKRLSSRKLEAEIVKCDMKSTPFVNSCFDAVICMKAIYHQKLNGIQMTISEVNRVLKTNGLFLVDFHSIRSSKHGKGIRVEANTFLQENGAEEGVLHHFVDERELQELLENFRIIDLETREKTINSYQQSQVIVTSEKT